MQASTQQFLRGLMSRFQVKDLVNTDGATFRRRLDEFLNLRDHEMEGFVDPARQRDLSVQFHWGHDHDFGAFALRGRMGERHIRLLETFMDRFGEPPRSLAGRRVLDIGCWTGGTSLLLSAMGASVVAIEEVRKYARCAEYLAGAFGLTNLHVRNLSLYECTPPDLQDAFDYALLAGVLYHVTDPVLALRIVFNCLKDGGVCLLETMSSISDSPIAQYEGPNLFHAGSAEALNRGGWNWFVPSPPAVARMMADVGFVDVRLHEVRGDRTTEPRTFAVARRQRHVDMLRGGLSARSIR